MYAARWSPASIHAIGQPFRAPDPGRWPLEQVAAFGEVVTRGAAGVYSEATIGVEAEPPEDSARTVNAAALADCLPPPFVAHVDPEQHGADADGWLEWTAPIVVTRGTGLALLPQCRANDGLIPVTTPRVVPPGAVPLGIGHTLPSRTLHHLEWDGGVARWPYGSPDLRLFVNLGSRAACRMASILAAGGAS